MTEKKAAEHFWAFALSIYSREVARKAFLRLQDRDGADVPLLLWCLWCGAEGRSISATVMKEAITFSHAWQTAAITPLRTLRRSLKSGIENIALALSERARSEIGQTEQALERMQMDHLASLALQNSHTDAETLIALYAELAGLNLNAEDIAIITQDI